MTLQQIRYAIVIAEAGSINKAAEVLYVTQPSLTSAVRELEKEIGEKIFDRGRNGVSVTEEGLDFLMHARRLYQDYENILNVFGKGEQKKEKFNVSTQHFSITEKAFVNLINEIDIQEYEFDVFETTSKEVIDDVSSYKSEIGILVLNYYNKSIIEKVLKNMGLSYYHLKSCELKVYISASHPLADKNSISVKELLDYPCLLFEHSDNISFHYAKEVLNIKDFSKIVMLSDRASMLDLLINLNGYTLCSNIIFEELSGKDYVAIPLEVDTVEKNIEIGYITREGSRLSKIGELYIEKIKEYIGL